MGHFNCCHVSDKLKILTTEGGGGVSTVESVIRGLVDYQKKCVAGILKILPTTSEHTVYSVKDYMYTVKVFLLYFITSCGHTPLETKQEILVILIFSRFVEENLATNY